MDNQDKIALARQIFVQVTAMQLNNEYGEFRLDSLAKHCLKAAEDFSTQLDKWQIEQLELLEKAKNPNQIAASAATS
jgi:hypothetical protein